MKLLGIELLGLHLAQVFVRDEHVVAILVVELLHKLLVCLSEVGLLLWIVVFGLGKMVIFIDYIFDLFGIVIQQVALLLRLILGLVAVLALDLVHHLNLLVSIAL